MKPNYMSFGLGAIGLIASVSQGMTAPPKRPVGAPPAIAKAEPPVCATMMSTYDEYSKKLALNRAADSVDDSAPRSAMRSTEDAATISQAQTTMQLMVANGCKAPTYAPSAHRYASASLTCASAKQNIRTKKAMDRLNDRIAFYDEPAECNTSTWTPNR